MVNKNKKNFNGIMKTIIILIIVSLLIYNIRPISSVIFPIIADYLFMIDLWFINPLYALISSIIMSKKYGFNILIVLLISILFIPTILLYYNTTALIYVIIYFLLAFIGGFIGGFIYKKRSK